MPIEKTINVFEICGIAKKSFRALSDEAIKDDPFWDKFRAPLAAMPRSGMSEEAIKNLVDKDLELYMRHAIPALKSILMYQIMDRQIGDGIPSQADMEIDKSIAKEVFARVYGTEFGPTKD